MMAEAPVAIDEQNPWPGLGAFDESAERFFNGRARQIAELRRLVRNGPLTVLHGASGLGKTSLLKAGLFPVLRKERILPIYVRLNVSDRSAPLIEQAKRRFQDELSSQRVDAPPFGADESLWRYLHRAGLELWSVQNQLLNPLFVFDQFEEVFTLGAANADAVAALQTDLADLAENRVPAALAEAIAKSDTGASDLALDSHRYKVLLSFRSDFLPAVERWKRKIPSLMRNRAELLAMSDDQAMEAIHKTAPHLASEAMAEKIVHFVAAAQESETGRAAEAADDSTEIWVEPALLSVLCRGLNERRKTQRKAAFDDDLLKSSGSSIISDFYRESVADLSDGVRAFIGEELITEGGYRKACDREDALTVHHLTEKDIDLLVARRLVRIEREHGRERLELTHDLLTRVVREDRGRRRAAAREQTEAKARSERWRNKVIGSGIVVLLGLVLLFVTLFRHAARQAILATAGRLAMTAVLNKDSAPDLAALLSLEAYRTADTLDTRGALLVAFQSNPLLQTYLHHETIVQSAAYSPDGKLLATAGADGVIRLWDTALHRLAGDPLKGHRAGVNHVAFSPDGSTLASASDDNTIRLWDIAGRKSRLELTGHEGVVNFVDFSPFGGVIASAGVDGTIRLWEATTGAPVRAPLQGHKGNVWSVRFSPDGKTIVSAGADQTVRLWNGFDRAARRGNDGAPGGGLRRSLRSRWKTAGFGGQRPDGPAVGSLHRKSGGGTAARPHQLGVHVGIPPRQRAAGIRQL